MSKKIKLLNLLLESLAADDDSNSDNYDAWVEYLNYEGSCIAKEEVEKLIRRFNLKVDSREDFLVILTDSNQEKVWLEYDKENETFDVIDKDDVSHWFHNLTDVQIETIAKCTSDDVYNAYIECTLKKMEQNPGKVYHYTNEDSWEEIQKAGYIKGSSGTGLTNRYVHGIFTSTNPEEYADGTYGDICLELDLETFKIEKNLSKLNLSYEPDVAECLLKELAVVKLELEDRVHIELDSSNGYSYSTIIVHHNIPVKYITVL